MDRIEEKSQPDLKYPASLIRETWLKELKKVGREWKDYKGSTEGENKGAT